MGTELGGVGTPLSLDHGWSQKCAFQKTGVLNGFDVPGTTGLQIQTNVC